MSLISPIPNSITDPLFRQFLESVRNALNGRVNVQGYEETTRDLISSWKKGDMIFNETTNKLNRYDGTAWAEL